MTTTMQMTPQNFSIPAGYDDEITFEISPAVTSSLEGCSIWWRAYNQQFGIPNFGFSSVGSPGPSPVIEKASPADIITIDSPLSFTVALNTADTINLTPGNLYHEVTIFSATQEIIGTSWGLMTILQTINRP